MYCEGSHSNAGTTSYQNRIKQQYSVCKVCRQDLLEEEYEFYPCNCKYQVEEKDRKCPNCYKLYEVQRINEQIKKNTINTTQSCRKVKDISSTIETYSSSNLSCQSNSIKQITPVGTTTSSVNNVHASQKRNSSDNNRQVKTVNNLSQVRILQKHILYVIGISPLIAKEETLRRYEYFGQYGRILSITINKDNAFQSENQGTCYSVYITYSTPQEASLAILAVDQHVFDSRLIRASFGRTKYCKFFLKETSCLNKDCPYMHSQCSGQEVLTQDDMQKKQLFQQCQQLAFQLSKVCEMDEEEFRKKMRQFKEQNYPGPQNRPIMPPPEHIFDNRKQLTKLYNQYVKANPLKKIRKMTMGPQTTQEQFDQSKIKCDNQFKERAASHVTKEDTYQKKTKDQQKTKEELKVDAETQKRQRTQSRQILDKQGQSSMSLKQDTNAEHKKRNNSSDERRKNSSVVEDLHSKTRIQNFEQQLANSLIKHLAPSNKVDDTMQEAVSTGQTISLFNEKKTSRFLSLKDDDDEEDVYRDSPILSRRPSFNEKKNSMQSLIVESLKFLNDDTDVVPKKREPLIQQQLYKTNPPSEVWNIGQSTPAPSHIGGFLEEDWNNTVFSTYDNVMYQQTVGAFDEKSYYSHQVINNNIKFNNTQDLRHSIYTSSYFNNQHQKSTAFNDSQQNKTTSFSNKFYGGNFGMPMGQQNQDFNTVGRRTTFINNQTVSSIVGEGMSLQLTRSPSQPNFANNALNQAAIAAKTENTAVTHRAGMQGQQNPFKQDSGPFAKADLNFQFQNYSLKEQAYNADNQGNRLHSSSYDIQSYTLNQQNLDLFDRKYEASKDILYAKIFLQDGAQSNNNIVSSQSLFCYNCSQFDDENSYTYNKFSDRYIPRTPVKGGGFYIPSTDQDEDQYLDDKFRYEKEEDQMTGRESAKKDYYQEYLKVKEGFFSGHLFRQKRRNSLDHDRELLHPQQLQFNSPVFGEESKIKDKKRSNSRSPQTKKGSSNQRD